MDRSKLSDAERRGLSLMVMSLFEGSMISIPVGDGEVKYLCFRMAGEDLPVLPDGESLTPSETGLFLSGEVFCGGKLVNRTWLGMGSLDEILITLESLGNVRNLLARFLHESSIRAALGVSKDHVISLGRLGGLEETFQSPMAALQSAADGELDRYDFGDDCDVVAHDGWESTARGTAAAEFTKVVYVRFNDDPEGADSHKVGFTVRFEHGDVVDVAAIEQRHGNEIGQRCAPPEERPRG